MDLGISDRSFAITGGSRGIGRAAGELLAADGADVLLIARGERDLAEAAESCNAAAGDGSRIATLAIDVTDPDAGEQILGVGESAFGKLDGVINNAGVATWRDIDDVPDEDWYSAWELNVMAPLRLMRSAVPPMVERGWGRVVNVSSTAGKRPSARMAEYSVAKAAQLSLSRLYADRHAADGVLVNAVCPGPVASEMWMEPGGLLDQSMRQAGLESREEALEEAGSKRPIGRLAEVTEIAGAIAFLCSQHASYTAGAAWSVDGGTVQVII